MRPAQTLIRISEDRPLLLTFELTLHTVQLLFVESDPFFRIQRGICTQSISYHTIRLLVVTEFDKFHMGINCISLNVIPDKISEMTRNAVRSSLLVVAHHLADVPVVEFIKLIIGCSVIPTLLRIMDHQHLVACTAIQETPLSCHYMIWK